MDGDVQEIFLLRKSMHMPLASECRIFQCLSLPGVWDLEGWNRSACKFGPWFWFYSKNRHLRHASSNVFNWYTCTKRQKTTILQLDVGSLGQAAKVLEHFPRKLAPRWTWKILDVKGWLQGNLLRTLFNHFPHAQEISLNNVHLTNLSWSLVNLDQGVHHLLLLQVQLLLSHEGEEVGENSWGDWMGNTEHRETSSLTITITRSRLRVLEQAPFNGNINWRQSFVKRCFFNSLRTWNHDD